jgi:hypothetical protein
MYFESRTFDRFCAAFRFASDDTWGIVGQLERQVDLRRDTLYRDCERIRIALDSDRPGPKPDPTRPLVARIDVLEREKAALRTQVIALEAQLSRCVEVTPQRIENLVLTAVTTPPSYVGIGEYVQVAFGEAYRPSVGKISALVTQFGTTAGKILTDSRVTDRFDEGCADELFAGRRPILTVIEPASLAIGAVERSDHRDGADWQGVLEQFGNLRYVSSDLGTGLRAGIGLCAHLLRHHPDFWHLVVRPLSRITRALEAQLDQAWDRERKAIAQQQLPKGKGKLYTPTVERIRREVSEQFDRMERYYQGVELLWEAFDPIVDEPGTPRLRSREEAERLLERAIDKLTSVEESRLTSLLRKLEAHRGEVFCFLDQLHEQVANVALEGVNDPQQAILLRALVLQEILLARQRAHTPDAQVATAYATVWQKIVQLGSLLKYYPLWRKAIAACVYRPRRSSSLVETINSSMRTLQQIHRNLSQPLLDLYAFRHNMKPFGNGCRRKGTSPYQRLGVDLGTDDWLEALRTYRTAA